MILWGNWNVRSSILRLLRKEENKTRRSRFSYPRSSSLIFLKPFWPRIFVIWWRFHQIMVFKSEDSLCFLFLSWFKENRRRMCTAQSFKFLKIIIVIITHTCPPLNMVLIAKVSYWSMNSSKLKWIHIRFVEEMNKRLKDLADKNVF